MNGYDIITSGLTDERKKRQRHFLLLIANDNFFSLSIHNLEWAQFSLFVANNLHLDQFWRIAALLINMALELSSVKSSGLEDIDKDNKRHQDVQTLLKVCILSSSVDAGPFTKTTPSTLSN